MGTILQQYFTESQDLVRFMQSKLILNENCTLLEPAAGRGALITGLNKVQITAYELDPGCIEYLRDTIDNITLYQEDFLLSSNNKRFDNILANPPYGAGVSMEYRAALKAVYPGFYVKDTYTIFLLKSLTYLKENGMLCFIIPCTFLFLNQHANLLRYVLNHYEICTLDIFPSKLFPGISFGYADLCIISIRNSGKATNNFQFKYVKSISDLYQVPYREISIADLSRIYVASKSTHINITNRTKVTNVTIGDIARTATGFYSGNDKKYYRISQSNTKAQRKFTIVDGSLVYSRGISRSIIGGIEDKQYFIPVLKGGGWNYRKPIMWYVDWSKTAVDNYHCDKKARFQNADVYFKKGIGVPMVKTKKMTSSLIDNMLFDQSIVGVFPNEEKFFYYLLAFFNTEACLHEINKINPTANNSARYIQRIPFIIPTDEELNYINSLVEKIINSEFSQKIHNKIESFFKSKYSGNITLSNTKPMELPLVFS